MRIKDLSVAIVCITVSYPELSWGQWLKDSWKKASDSVSQATESVSDKTSEMMEGPPPDEERAELQQARANALEQLYEESPDMRDILAGSKGYAVFSSFGMNLFVVSTQRGGGILHDNRSSDDTYMKMFSAGGGLGLGVKDFAAIFVFHTDSAIDQFVTEGWDFSGQADAGAQHKEDGSNLAMSTSAMPGTSLYQLTESGLAAQVTLQGTKFWKDDDLN